MDNDVSIRLADHGSDEYRSQVDLRRAVLRKPLGLDFTELELQAEAEDLFLGAWIGPTLCGCLVLTSLDAGRIKMRQVAVGPGHQGQGIGAQLVSAAEQIARAAGYTEMVLNARISVVNFYLKLGYDARGEEFIEVTIPHRAMHKRLAK